MSPGIRSGVNWIRPKSSPSARAKHWARKVLAVPGGPSSRTWPEEKSAISMQLDRLVLADNGLGHVLPDPVGEGFDVCHVHRMMSFFHEKSARAAATSSCRSRAAASRAASALNGGPSPRSSRSR